MYPPTRFLLVPVLLALTASLFVGVPSHAGTPNQDYARAAFKATNKVRVAKDRDRLGNDRCLRRAAARQARKMAGQETIFHQILEPLLDGCLLSWVGENVAYGYASGSKTVWQGWMKSTDHRRNLLARKWTDMGIAARQSDDGTWYVAQVFGKLTS